ncbi:unnamed protein product [Triticum turgidum subsp. durum]|uniref:Uncharacterized protein n=1 Tax=Triticum turgidum subsp. durum TaxID=4567 RepID=A0A9R0RE19_TRITD|nr:unnamed protein product [Triticum turgidum subsp. durum]
MPDRGLQIAVWVVLAAGIGVAFYFFFVREGARDEVAGQRREAELHQVSPEQRSTLDDVLGFAGITDVWGRKSAGPHVSFTLGHLSQI